MWAEEERVLRGNVGTDLGERAAEGILSDHIGIAPPPSYAVYKKLSRPFLVKNHSPLPTPQQPLLKRGFD